jgi:mono/diheme cytochrome c family protein
VAAFVSGLEDMGVKEEAEAERPQWQAQGGRVYQRQCRACHQADGSGIPGTFPPLAGQLPELLAREGSRAYLIDGLLYGIAGEIEVGGRTYRGMMPGFARLDDGDLASLLNYIARAWGNEADLPEDFEPFAADEVAERRGRGLRPHEVGESRPD